MFCIYTRPSTLIEAKLMRFSRTSNLFNSCVHAVIMTVSYFLHSFFLHACGVLMIPVNENKSWLSKKTLNFTLVPVIWVCGLVYKNGGSSARVTWTKLESANILFHRRRQGKMGSLLVQQLFIWEPLNIFIVVFSSIRLE